MRVRAAFLLVLAIGAAARGACPGRVEVDFLRGLNGEGRYSLAAVQGELHLRRLERDSSCTEAEGLRLETGRAYYHLGDFPRAREIFRKRAGDERTCRRYYLEAHLLDLGRPDLADSVLAFVASQPSPESEGAEPGSWTAGEPGLYRAAALYLRGDLAAARSAWPAEGGGVPGGVEPRSYLDLGYKSPGLAAWLSVAPGGGYFYAGQPADGWAALAAVVLLYGAAAWYLHHDAQVRGWAAAAMGGVFHLSGIYGGHRAAREANRTRRIGFLKAMHGRLP